VTELFPTPAAELRARVSGEARAAGNAGRGARRVAWRRWVVERRKLRSFVLFNWVRLPCPGRIVLLWVISRRGSMPFRWANDSVFVNKADWRGAGRGAGCEVVFMSNSRFVLG